MLNKKKLSMHISLREEGEFFRGLLLLIRKDHKIADEEKTMLMLIGKSFGFAPSFCKVAVGEILENTYISDCPPVFSSKRVAKFFIKEGFIIANCDKEFHPDEEQWLRVVGQQNDVDKDWYLREKEKSNNHKKSNLGFDDQIRKYLKNSNSRCNRE